MSNPTTPTAGETAASAIADAESYPPITVTAENMREMNEARLTKLGPTNSHDGYLAVMLVGRAGWSRQQTADFLGISLQSVNLFCNSWERDRLRGLVGLSSPVYTDRGLGGGMAGSSA